MSWRSLFHAPPLRHAASGLTHFTLHERFAATRLMSDDADAAS
jgi:hypothetical protein